MPLMPESNLPPDEPQVEPTVRELLVAEVDATCRRTTLELGDPVEPVVGVDEVQLRAAARPLDEPES
jgi:hypothetical protein